MVALVGFTEDAGKIDRNNLVEDLANDFRTTER